jgi:hypothetical protein
VRSFNKLTDQWVEGLATAFFPSTTGSGITGELVWGRQVGVKLGVAQAPIGFDPSEADRDPLCARRRLLSQYRRYLDALSSVDLDGVLDVLADDAQALIRDYVEDTGTLINLDAKSAHRSYYRSFFDKFQVVSVEPLYWIAQPWYVFAEVRMTVRVRSGAEEGTTLAFHTAESFSPGDDGLFLVRMGHGTDLAPLTIATNSSY